MQDIYAVTLGYVTLILILSRGLVLRINEGRHVRGKERGREGKERIKIEKGNERKRGGVALVS